MEQDKELKDLVNKMFMEKAPDNFEANLLSKIDELVEKPLPVYAPLIPRKVWLVLFVLTIFICFGVTLYGTPLDIDTKFIDAFMQNLEGISMLYFLIPFVPLTLYFIDIYREYRFNLKYQTA